MNDIITTILLASILLSFAIFIIVLLNPSRTIKSKARALSNKVHFYVTRDKDTLSKGMLNLWINKPERGVNIWYGGTYSRHITIEGNFCSFGLNPSDYDNLKWEDEPVEVFLNLED